MCVVQFEFFKTEDKSDILQIVTEEFSAVHLESYGEINAGNEYFFDVLYMIPTGIRIYKPYVDKDKLVLPVDFCLYNAQCAFICCWRVHESKRHAYVVSVGKADE